MDTVLEENTKNPAVKNRKVMLLILVLVILVAGLLVSLYLAGQTQEIRKKAAGSGVILGISPSTLSAAPNDTITVGVTVDTGNATISAAELHLTYDATKLEAQSITAGSYLPVVLSAGQVGGGNASIILGSQPTNPQKGSGVLASVTFKALIPSTSGIDFASTTQVAAIGITGNAVPSTFGSQITVNPPSATSTPVPTTPTPTPLAVPSVTPTPTLTPTVTPTPTISIIITPILFPATVFSSSTPIPTILPTLSLSPTIVRYIINPTPTQISSEITSFNIYVSPAPSQITVTQVPQSTVLTKTGVLTIIPEVTPTSMTYEKSGYVSPTPQPGRGIGRVISGFLSLIFCGLFKFCK